VAYAFAVMNQSRLRKYTFHWIDKLMAALDAETVAEEEWIEAAERAGEQEAAGDALFMRSMRAWGKDVHGDDPDLPS
jgi:hypothetical protein